MRKEGIDITCLFSNSEQDLSLPFQRKRVKVNFREMNFSVETTKIIFKWHGVLTKSFVRFRFQQLKDGN